MGDEPKRAKRGRPPAEAISKLIIEGHQSTHKVKCKYCHRTFPRDKSLTAHVRTHTGEKPFLCTFPVPKCGKRFKQSGHLRTHERLHTDDYCFKCPIENCTMRFKHTNRSCSNHPNAKLIRETEPGYPDNLLTEEVLKSEHPDVIEWLRGYIQRFKNSRKTPDKRGGSKALKRKQDSCLHSSQVESFDQSYDLSDTSAQNLSICGRDSYTNHRDMQSSVLANIFASPVSQVGNSGEQYQMSSACSGVLDCSASTADYSFANNFDCSLVSSPQKDQSLLTVNESDIACTPTRSTVFSTPVESPYLATPKNTTRQLNANHDSSHFSTPGQSNYCTPLGRSTMYTSNEGIRFSTPLDTKLHFPGLGPDFTSTPVAGFPETPDHPAPGSLPRAPCGSLRKNVTVNKRIKSRRILGPLMEATHGRVSTNVGASIGEASDHRSLKSQVSDENSYGQSDSVPKSFPSSPQHSRVFRNKQNQLLPSKKSDLCLDMDGIKPINDEGLPYVYRDSLFSSNASYSLNDDRPSPFVHHQHSAKVLTNELVAHSSTSTSCTYSQSDESRLPPKTGTLSSAEVDPVVTVKVEPEITDEGLPTSDVLHQSEEHHASRLKSSAEPLSFVPRTFAQEYPASSSTSQSVQSNSVSIPRVVKTYSTGGFMQFEKQGIFIPRSEPQSLSQLTTFSSMHVPRLTHKFSSVTHDDHKSYKKASDYSQNFDSWPALSPVQRSQIYGQQLQYIDVKREVCENSCSNTDDPLAETPFLGRPDQHSVQSYKLDTVPESTNSTRIACTSYNERFDTSSRATSCQRKLPFSQPTSHNDVKLPGIASFSIYYEPISPASPELASKNIDDAQMEHEEAHHEVKNVDRLNLNSALVSCSPVTKLTSSQQSTWKEQRPNRCDTNDNEEIKCQSSSDTDSNILYLEELNSSGNYFKPHKNMQSDNSKIVTAEPDSSSNQPIAGILTVRTKAARKSYTPTKRFSAALKAISPHKVYPKKRWMSRVNAQATKASHSFAWRSFNSPISKDELVYCGEEVFTNSGAQSDSTVTSNLNLSIDEFDSTLATPTAALSSEGAVLCPDRIDEVSSTVSSLGNTSFDDVGLTHVTAAQVDITVTSGVGTHNNFHYDYLKSDSNVHIDKFSFLDSSLTSNEPLNLSTR